MELLLPDGSCIIVDAGTGIRELGVSLQARAEPQRSVHLFFTHFHWDHIQGLPFFEPLYCEGSQIVFHSSPPPREARNILEGQMSYPYFPFDFRSLRAQREFDQNGTEPFRYKSLLVQAFPMNHPQGAVGYRFECEGAVVVHASDCEHGNRELDSVLRDHAQNADVLIYDAQYTPEEYEHKHQWGHSTWLEATKVAREMGVKQLILFHHDPSHDDAAVARITAEARAYFENTVAAREGWVARL